MTFDFSHGSQAPPKEPDHTYALLRTFLTQYEPDHTYALLRTFLTQYATPLSLTDRLPAKGEPVAWIDHSETFDQGHNSIIAFVSQGYRVMRGEHSIAQTLDPHFRPITVPWKVPRLVRFSNVLGFLIYGAERAIEVADLHTRTYDEKPAAYEINSVQFDMGNVFRITSPELIDAIRKAR